MKITWGGVSVLGVLSLFLSLILIVIIKIDLLYGFLMTLGSVLLLNSMFLFDKNSEETCFIIGTCDAYKKR